MAITGSTYVGRYKKIGHSQYSVCMLLTDNAKPSYEEWFDVKGSTTQEIEYDLRRQLAARVASASQEDVLANIPAGTSIAITAPPVSAAATADQTWANNVRLVTRVAAHIAAGLSHAQLTTDLNALKASNNAGYTTARGALL